jgi:hypothetical protein
MLNVDCATNDLSTHFECHASRPIAVGAELLAPYGGGDAASHIATQSHITALPSANAALCIS